MSRCTGHCCKAFGLSLSLDELRTGNNPDHRFVANMVIPLGYFASGELLPDGDVSKGGEYYTCKHFDTETGDCLVYNIRPHMCRDLGVTIRCNKRGCSLGPREDRLLNIR